MNNLVVIRFGNTSLTKPEKKVIQSIAGEHAYGCAFATIGIITIIQTELTHQEVSQVYQKLSLDEDDSYPCIIYTLDSVETAIYGLDVLAPAFSLMRDKFLLETRAGNTQITYSLNELLDKIGEIGYDNLTPSEKEALDKFSK